jgi:hypothetical protein
MSESAEGSVGILEMDTRGTPKDWDAQYTNEYLLALSRGKEYVLPNHNFPETITFQEPWHNLLNGMRDTTRAEGVECFAYIGTNSEKQKLFLPNFFVRGKKGAVTHETMASAWNTQSKAGVTNIIGDIHTHPRGYLERLHDRLRPLTPLAAFSNSDLYGLVIGRPGKHFMGVTDGDNNLFVFRSKETSYRDLNRNSVTQEQFSKYWHNQGGNWYLGSGDRGEMAVPKSPYAPTIQEINRRIAEEYGLVIYRGRTNEPIQRVV